MADIGSKTSYYTGALQGLRFIEAGRPSGRRFDADADARWGAFKGDLTTADRIDLLIRDADAQWAGAFGARTVFALRAASEDDAFGSEWSPLDPVDAEELWRDVIRETEPASIADALRRCAQAWELPLTGHPTIEAAPADKLLLVGPSAIIAAAEAFAAGSDLDWSDQVVCIATRPAHRQLAAMAAGLLNASRACHLIAMGPDDTSGPTEADVALCAGRRPIISEDADPADATWAQNPVAAPPPPKPSPAADVSVQKHSPRKKKAPRTKTAAKSRKPRAKKG